jgi:rfaE bifunctional protein nucleotidyltransferase chain/domain
MDFEEVQAARAAFRESGKTVVLTNGCFDILHAGHLSLLEEARALGDVLIVALNSDASVRALKGPDRPLIPLAEREEVLLGLEPVDLVCSYDEETPARLISALLPDVLVKGADWGEGAIVGREAVEAAGGRVVRIQLLPGRSTTALVSQIRKP